jgi:hypothetical protein
MTTSLGINSLVPVLAELDSEARAALGTPDLGVRGSVHLVTARHAVADCTTAGLVPGILYPATDRNLWAPIIAHGMTDTISFLVLYMGWLEI